MKWMDEDKVIEWVLVLFLVFMVAQGIRAGLNWFLN